MQVKYLCPYWGSSHLSAKQFISKALRAGYDGVEINLPDDTNFDIELKEALAETACDFIGQQWLPPATETFEQYRQRMLQKLKRLVALKPQFINAHTGKDFFSFAENCSLIETCFQLSQSSGINIVHETHRGRFNFQLATSLRYIDKFPELKFNADFSHFCAVSESLLEDQEQALEKLLPHCRYIHARVGFDQSAQVNDPFAPEWQYHLERFVQWWQKIIDLAKLRNEKEFFICPEFGPFPYIQQLPYTKKETVDQWDTNVKMMEFLKSKLIC
ncbi:TIM barrel protein [uncultured Draconibacterium sp.]|uniref:sugar phosphate isomerase/epimerase family protein n=1 Tax=uncultured Draconibacterium sp. TaxID=1573823 RepID=UPI0025FE0569|nr:TIM barrel protein [uncultured Draconibacterium sp.]